MTYPGGGGGQGGWNDQPGWGQQQQGDYQSGGYQAGGYPSTGGFPQQGYGGAYGGLGVYGGGGFDEQPPKKSKKTLWLVLGVVVFVLLGGGGVTWFLLSRNSGQDPSAQNNSTNPPSSSKQVAAGPCKNDDMQCVQTSLGYSYEVPKDWVQVSDRIPIDKYPGVALSGVSAYGEYSCEGKAYTKGTNGGALLEKGDVNQVATDFAKAVATQFYSSGGDPVVTLTPPKPVKIDHTQKDGKKVVVEGAQVDATITQNANKCLADKGMVKVVVLNGSSKLHALVINGDLAGGGGGDKPPLPKEADLQKMIDSLVPAT